MPIKNSKLLALMIIGVGVTSLLIGGHLIFAEGDGLESIADEAVSPPGSVELLPKLLPEPAPPLVEAAEPPQSGVDPVDPIEPAPEPEVTFTIVKQMRERYLFNGEEKLELSDECGAVYYVILLFRQREDYVSAPRSYLVNRAYPCADGHFSYRLTDDGSLPTGLDGTYYLLVGEEEETGPWRAVSTPIPLQIERKIELQEIVIERELPPPEETPESSVAPSPQESLVPPPAPEESVISPDQSTEAPAEEAPPPETPAAAVESEAPADGEALADPVAWRRLKQILVAILDFFDQRLVAPALARVR